MPKNFNRQINRVVIRNGFPGIYSPIGGSSFYLDGNGEAGDIHFSVNPNPVNQFSAFHLTRSVDGSNVGIWYNETPGGGIGPASVNARNLPGYKQGAWAAWWEENHAACDAAALDFWNTF
jgi:hypothetical protein